MNSMVHFLGWSQPLVTAAAAWLGSDATRLRRTWVVIPTRESGRRLRQALVEVSRRAGLPALLGPRMATPDDFFRVPEGMPESIRWAGWIRTLEDCPDELVSALFPNGLKGKSAGWQSAVARQLEQARDLLAAGNASFAIAAAQFEPEQERWSQLAALERKVVAIWKSWGFSDPVAAKRQRASQIELPPGCQELVVVGVPDPTWLAVSAWERLRDQGVPISILVGAPESLRSGFDEWGRPLAGFWTDRTRFAVPDATAVRVAADSFGLAELMAQACAGRGSHQVALGLCDATFLPSVTRRFSAAGWPVYDPQPSLTGAGAWPELLERLAAAIEQPTHYGRLSALARHSVVWQAAEAGWSPFATLRALDEWEREASPCDAKRAIATLKADTDKGRQAAGAWLDQVSALIEGTGPNREARLWRWILERAAPCAEVADALAPELESWDCLKGISLPLRLRWLAATAASVTLNPDPDPDAIPVQGWLELSFDPAPHLVLGAAHEGRLPEAPATNPLVTDNVRERFSLRDRQSRLARDVFLYAALIHARHSGGSVTVVNAQVDPTGEPCKPSRVLLQTALDTLPGAVMRLVKEQPDLPPDPTPAWERGPWGIRPGPDTPRTREWKALSPTALRAYLACPTRFYFERVLKWERFEPFDEELDGKAFGTLFHTVLDRWAKAHAPCRQSDPDKLRALWLGLLDEISQEQFGNHRPPLLRLQLMSVRERLTALARVQAELAGEGWEVVETEKELTGALVLAGIPLQVRVDRIDRHPDGRVRVLDYKTGRRGIEPRRAHLASFDPAKHPEPLGPLTGPKSNMVWTDLQLPLYALVVSNLLKLETAPEVGYILLPEAVNDTRFARFDDLEAWLENAHQWAETAAARIRDGVFWPPAPEPRHDDFARLAPDGLQAALGAPWAEFLSKPQPAP